ncbi:MAG: zinc ribbon domain-containing protein [Pseudomonadota bacterium]
MQWAGYKSCCHRTALTPAAAFCGECGTPLLRCMNFSDCFQLVEPFKPCPVCLTPELVVEAGATVGGGVGARVAIPLKLRNQNAEARRPIFLKRLQKRERDGAATDVPLDWEQIDPGAERSFLVEAGPFETDGVARMELLMTLATRSKEGYEEAYVFGGALLLTVARESAQQVVQNIDFSGAHFETGGLVKTDLKVAESAGAGLGAEAGRRVVSLERFELSEVKDGVRGYAESGRRVSRAALFSFRGFPGDDAPGFETGLGARGALAFGRAGRERDPERNPTPMDASLRVYGADGAVDAAASGRISRHHFDLTVLNDRLCLHVRSAKGVAVNGRAALSGAVEPIEDGALITPDESVDLAMRVRFSSGPGGVVERVDLVRESKAG